MDAFFRKAYTSHLKMFIEYLAYLNLVIAFSAFTIAAGGAKIIGIDNYWEYGLFVFFATLFVYNIQRFTNVNKDSTAPRMKWMYVHRKLVFSSISISLIFSSYYFIKLMEGFDFTVILIMSIPAIISLFYIVRIGKRNLREISYVKTHSIALAWTTVLLIFPLINENLYNPKLLIFFILPHYLYFLGVAATFDINDLKVDPLTQRTIPQIVGFQHTKKVATILLIISGFGISYYLFSPFIVLAICTQMLLIISVTDNRPHYYFNIYIDGAISLLGISYLVI